MTHIAIFASGNGTNAQRISEYFMKSTKVKITCVYSNKKDAYVLTRAKNLNIRTFVFDKTAFYESNEILNKLLDEKTDLIVLAGFLWKIPLPILQNFRNRIINIHPALLPKYGGKGMYGSHVHEAVINSGDAESGITIHYVNENYDEGEIIFQAKCNVDSTDTPESLAAKIHQLEFSYYPRIIENVINDLIIENN